MRAEFDDRPSERDMDFEALDRPAPARGDAAEEPAPRRRAPRRTSTRTTSRTRASEPQPEEVSQEPAGREPAPRMEAPAPRLEEAPAEPAPRPNEAPAAREDEPAGHREGSGYREGAGRGEAFDQVDGGSDPAGYFPDDASGPMTDGGDFQNRRRRRRRRGGRGQGDGPIGNQGGGNYGQGGNSYGRQQPHRGGRQQNNQQGGPRRQHGGQHSGQHSGAQHGGRQHDRQNQGPRVEGPPVPVLGVLELHPKGYGFIREAKAGYFSQETDPFVSSSIIQKLGLREGVQITGEAVSGGRGQGPRLRQVDTIEGRTIEAWQQIRSFEDLTAVNPFEQIKLETGPTPITMRIMDLLTPIGKGQRALIVAPPRSGKTMLLQEIADSVSKNHPEIYLMVLLIDERPEEVTEMRRRVRGEVIASSMDREVESHVRVSQLMFERAKRMTESGRDVFILLDSITRTARAFNKWTSNTGRTMSGGLDVKAMDIPKKMFGTARRFEEGGSLTVVGTALIETGSRMDDVIFQEFKGTGNMEMVLSRDLADRRIWPAIDISKSGTRREEKILSPEVMEGVTLLRRSLVSMNPIEAMEQLTKTLGKFPSNAEFLEKVRSVL